MNILIVDDEPAIIEVLAYALSADGFSVDSCGLGGDALTKIGAKDYSLIVLDVGLPDMSGFDVCRQLRRQSEVPVIFLTARSEEVDRIVGLELGADDYVPKPFSPREVVSRVRAILRRVRVEQTQQPKSTNGTAFSVDKEGMRISYGGVWLNLTRYEYLLLAYLLERPRRVLSRASIMDHVWQDAVESDERTVDTHIKTLRAKLRVIRPEDDPIVTHRGLGYSIEPKTSF